MNAAYRTLVIEMNRKALLQVVAALVAMLPDVPVVTRWLHLTILETLRPAEAAVRRLIAMAASGLVVAPRARCALPGDIVAAEGMTRRPVFGLFDPRRCAGPPPLPKRARGAGPRLTVIGLDERDSVPEVAVSPDGGLDAQRLRRRLAAIGGALDDLAGQARRLARILASGRAKFLRPMRPGRPPGHRAQGRRAVDDILADCQAFALEFMDADARSPPGG